MKLTSLQLLTAAMVTGASATAAHAFKVTITTGPDAGTVVFDSGGFESTAVGSTPDPMDAAIGEWIQGPTALEGAIVLTGENTTSVAGLPQTSPTGAYKGDNYLTIDRTKPEATANTILNGSFTQDIDLATTSFEIDFAYWGDDGSYAAFGVGEDGMGRVTGASEDNMNLQMTFDGRTNPGQLNPVGNEELHLGSYTLGEWIEVNYAWDHVNSENVFTIDGNSYVIGKPDVSANTTAGEFTIGMGLNIPSTFFDSITETSVGINGDYNDSGLVEQGDLDQVLSNWGASFDTIPATWINQRPTEGIVDQAELDVVLTAWGSSAAPSFAGSTVPEPAALALFGGLGVLACRRRSA